MLNATKKSIQRQSCITSVNNARVARGCHENIEILVVDDRQENLLAMEAVFDDSGYKVTTAKSGEEALRCVLKEDFAVILLDVQMPGLDGFDTAKLIKAREKTRNIPIVFITAASQASEHVQKGFEVGAVDYIFKPFSPEILRRKVDALAKMAVSHRNVSQLVEDRTAQLRLANYRLRAEIAERKKLAETFTAIFEVCPSLMAILSQEGVILRVNQNWTKATGVSAEGITGKRIEDAGIECSECHEGPTLQDAVRQAMKNVRVDYHDKAGRKYEALLSAERVEYRNHSCIMLVLTDISDQVRLQQEVVRLDRLHVIGEMAAGLAHEIRNPMTTIRGFLQLSRERGRIATSHIDVMIEEIDRANSIITEFLSLAKDKRVDLKPLCINKVVEALYDLIRAEALLDSKNVKLNLTECGIIRGDEKELRQLVLNLALNGLEAMRPGGTLEISTAYRGEHVELSVKDNGHGITEEILDKIMMPFFTTKDCGTGLGLAICYSVAARHNAEIDIKTGSDGTTFVVSFLPEGHK